MKKLISKTKKWIELNPVLFIISLILITLSSTVSLIENTTKLYSYFSTADSIFRQYNAAQNKIDKLNIKYQISYFQEVLGNPIYINTSSLSNVDSTCSEQKEFVFKDELFYTQAIVDNKTKSVFAFSVTSRKDRFKPKLAGYQINSDKFSKYFKHLPEMFIQNSELNSNHFYYAESHPGGNATLYQTYYLAKIPSVSYLSKEDNINFDFTEIGGLHPRLTTEESKDYIEQRQESFDRFRSLYTFNTIGISYDEGFDCFQIGLEYNQERLLK